MIKSDRIVIGQVKHKRRIKMPKKDHEHLQMLIDAVSRFKKIQEQDPGDNDIFSKELDSATQKLQDKEHEAVTQKFTKSSKRLQTKTEVSEHVRTSITGRIDKKNEKLK